MIPLREAGYDQLAEIAQDRVHRLALGRTCGWQLLRDVPGSNIRQDGQIANIAKVIGHPVDRLVAEPPEFFGGQRARLLTAAPVITAAPSAEIDDDGHDQNDEIDPGERVARVDHPRVNDGGQRQKDEAQQRDQEAMVGALQKTGEEKQKHQSDARKKRDQDHEKAHGRKVLKRLSHWTMEGISGDRRETGGSLAIACVGLYGTTAYAVSRHKNEIGIRMALGAERRRIIWMVLREVLALAAVGLGVGLVCAW